jgi:hypothetical protein
MVVPMDKLCSNIRAAIKHRQPKCAIVSSALLAAYGLRVAHLALDHPEPAAELPKHRVMLQRPLDPGRQKRRIAHQDQDMVRLRYVAVLLPLLFVVNPTAALVRDRAA